MRRDVVFVVLGFLVGAAALAGGQDEDALRAKLRELQDATARALRYSPTGRVRETDERGYQLAIVPVADLVTPLTEYVPPARRMFERGDTEERLFGSMMEESPYPVGTAEELVELVRTQVWPETWERAAMIVAQRTNVILHNTPAVVRDTTRFLDQTLRRRVFRSVVVEAEVIDVSKALYRKLSSGGAQGLGTQLRGALEQELRDGAATRVFAGRVTGFANQRVILWHGRQIAVAQEPDVEVAEGSNTSDPRIDVLQAGATISVRPSLGDDPTRVRLDVSVSYDEHVPPLEQRETRQNWIVDMPRITRLGARASLGVPAGAWALVGAGTVGNGTRITLVRGIVLEAQGGAR